MVEDRKFFICVDNYISVEECNKYINTYDKFSSLSYIYQNTKPLKIQPDSTIKKIFDDFNINKKLDNLEIVKREEGSFMDNHFDQGDSLAFIIYLNENIKGGETVFENETVIYPKKGRLLLFSNGIFLHKVNEITEGKRYVLAGWCV